MNLFVIEGATRMRIARPSPTAGPAACARASRGTRATVSSAENIGTTATAALEMMKGEGG